MFRLGRSFSDDVLPPFTELVRFDAGPRLEGEELRDAALASLRRHLAHRPETNPFLRFGAALERDLPGLLEGDQENYHAYAFATVRMAGSAFEVCGSLRRLALRERRGRTGRRVGALSEIVEGCKLLSLKLARRREFDTEPAVAELAEAWNEAHSALDAVAG